MNRHEKLQRRPEVNGETKTWITNTHLQICQGNENAAWVYAAYEFRARFGGEGDVTFLALTEIDIQNLLIVYRPVKAIRAGRRWLEQAGILIEGPRGRAWVQSHRIGWKQVRSNLGRIAEVEPEPRQICRPARPDETFTSANQPSSSLCNNVCLNELITLLPPAMPQGKEEAKLLELLGTTVLEGRTVSGDDVSKMGAMLRTYPLRAQVKTLRKLETALRVGRPRTWYLVLAIIQDDGAAFAAAERNRRERPPQPHRRAVPEREPEPVMSAEELAWNEARNAEVRILLRLRAEGKRAEGDAKEREIVARFGPSFAQRPQARAAGA